MLYQSLRWVAGVALRWFYRRIDVVGAERVPVEAPLLIAANHPNQLIDALLVAYALPRPVTFTGKAVLLDNPVARVLLRHLPFVPLRRASDERARGSVGADRARNADAFRAIVDALAGGAAVLVFPEGISHGGPQLAPLKSGIARMALQARDERGVAGLHVLPVGLTFERKEAPRTRVLVEIGAPLPLDGWEASGAPIESLTREVEARLRAVTLNFPSSDVAARVLRVSHLLAGLLGEARPLGDADAPLAGMVGVSRRVEGVRRWVESPPAELAARADRFQARLDALDRALETHGIAPADVGIALGWRAGARFVVREGAIAAATGPLALWGRVNHWIPLRLARALAARSSRTAEDPAMHTLVAGLVAVPLFYLVQAVIVGIAVGPWWAAGYLLTLVPSASWDFRLHDRRRRAMRRVRAYLLLRRDRALRARLRDDVAWLREEAARVERLATGAESPILPGIDSR